MPLKSLDDDAGDTMDNWTKVPNVKRCIAEACSVDSREAQIHEVRTEVGDSCHESVIKDH